MTCTSVSSSEEEYHPHVLVDDAILKNMHVNLEKLNVLEKPNERSIRIQSGTNSIRGSVSDLKKGLDYVDTCFALFLFTNLSLFRIVRRKA